jgi:hypothetical protein
MNDAVDRTRAKPPPIGSAEERDQWLKEPYDDSPGDEVAKLRAAIGMAQAYLDRGDESDQLMAKALRSVL